MDRKEGEQMSILSTWFRKESTKVIFAAAVQILKAILGKVGTRLWEVAKEEVAKAQALPLTGREKADMVAKAVRAEIAGLPDYIVNLAIELAVTHFKESLIKR
jgi:hypothetical protein